MFTKFSTKFSIDLYISLCKTNYATLLLCGTLFPETKLHIQKYDGLEKIEKPSRALEVTLGSSTDPNSGHNPIKI